MVVQLEVAVHPRTAAVRAAVATDRRIVLERDRRLDGDRDPAAERSDDAVRELEGLQEVARLVWGAEPPKAGVPIKENGLDYKSGTWFGLIAPAKTPAAIVNYLNAEIQEILKEPATLQRLAQMGAVLEAA